MEIGKITLSLVSDGHIRMDGGGLYGVVPKAIWHRFAPADHKNRVKVALNCLLVRAEGKNILLDTGIGNKHSVKRRRLFAMDGGKLLQSLNEHGLEPRDIDIVALTHLHFDHVGGCTVSGPNGTLLPTFPRAVHMVQRDDWQEATEVNDRTRHAYFQEDFLPLEENGQLQLISGNVEIVPGVWLKRIGGHTSGHQMLFVESEGDMAACLGDVLPTQNHLPYHYITAFDSYPMDTIVSKRKLLVQAEAERWLIYLGHGVDEKAGFINKHNGRLVFTPLPIS